MAAFGSDLKIRVASKGDVPVASILTLSHKRSIVYKYGGSIPSLNKLGGMAFLFWRTIEEAKDKGYEELDLGRSDADNLGLITFKERWDAAGSTLDYWTYPPRPRAAASAWQKSLPSQLVKAAPDLVLEAVGSLLYKHVA
jgi:lipid II:glycine glycyltransferase (peptidoglycan interpeptide bridge formation enzyme)